MADKKRRTRKTLVEEVTKVSKEQPKSTKKSNSFLLPTGSDILDLVVGGGYPVGKIVNTVGDKSSGKTYLAIECIATCHLLLGKKLKWFYDNTESGFSFDTKAMYGLEILTKEMAKKRSFTVEEMGANLKTELSKIKQDEFLIYIVDSLDGLSSEAEMKRDKERQKALAEGKEYDKGTYSMEKQKFMSEFFRLRANEIEDKNCLLIIISQVRDNIGVMFGAKYRRSGGRALDFYAHTCLWLSETEKLKKKKRAIGINIKARTEKSKTKTPFREGFIELVFDYGIDNIVSNINYLYELKTDLGKDKKKEKLKWDEQEFTKPALIKHIEENDLEDELKQRVVDKWNEIEDSISSKDRKPKWKNEYYNKS